VIDQTLPKIRAEKITSVENGIGDVMVEGCYSQHKIMDGIK
jgi:hypothetical protein